MKWYEIAIAVIIWILGVFLYGYYKENHPFRKK